MVENSYGIERITIDIEAKCYCPLGKDWYTNKFTVEVCPGKYIPDYCELDAWVNENINGQHMIIERAVEMLHEHVVAMYHPIECHVASYVDDAAHSAVIVRK